jgi:hypothetical protein
MTPCPYTNFTLFIIQQLPFGGGKPVISPILKNHGMILNTLLVDLFINIVTKRSYKTVKMEGVIGKWLS